MTEGIETITTGKKSEIGGNWALNQTMKLGAIEAECYPSQHTPAQTS